MPTEVVFPMVLVALAAALAFGRADSKRYLAIGIGAIAAVILTVVMTAALV